MVNIHPGYLLKINKVVVVVKNRPPEKIILEASVEDTQMK